MAKEYNVGGELNDFGERTARIGQLERETDIIIETKEDKPLKKRVSDNGCMYSAITIGIAAAAMAYIVYEAYTLCKK